MNDFQRIVSWNDSFNQGTAPLKSWFWNSTMLMYVGIANGNEWLLEFILTSVKEELNWNI